MLTVSRFGPFNFAETATNIQYVGRCMYLKTSGLDGIGVENECRPSRECTPVQVVASQFADLDILTAPDRAVRKKQ